MDLMTLYYSTTAIAVSTAVVMVLAWHVHRGERAMWFWMLGSVAYAASTLLFSVSPILLPIVTRSLGDITSAIAPALLYAGTVVFLGRSPRWRLLAAFYIPAMLASLYGVLIADSLAYRVTGYTICAVSAGVLMAHGLMAYIAPAQRAVGRFLGSVWLGYSIVCLVRCIAAWDASPNATQLSIGVPQVMYFVAFPVVTVLVAFGHLMLISQRLQQKVADLSDRDEPAGTFNRRAFRSLVRDRRTLSDDTKSLVLMILDIDHFTGVNDRFGPAGGAEVLRSVARLIGDQLRKQDVFARAGGEEFWLLSADIPTNAALSVAERLRAAVERHRINVAGESVQITISIGVAVIHPDSAGIDLRKAMERADIALNEAKSQGRNRVILAPEDVSDSLESARFATRLASRQA